MNDHRAALDDLYDLLEVLEGKHGGKRLLAECNGRMAWPRRGVYFFFEDGETREDGVTQRVVRVGTHALRPSRSTLWGRLSQHKGTTAGSMPGGGNHRGSVFRLHVGAALLAVGDWPRQIRDSWSVGSTADAEVRRAEYPLERAVSDHIGRMPFLWVAIEDPPGPDSERGVIEAGAIALLSNVRRPPIDAPSEGWLGHYSPHPLIRQSGLWNVNHVQDPPDRSFIGILERYVAQTPVRKRVADQTDEGYGST